MSIPSSTFSPDPANLGVGIPSLQDANGLVGLPGGSPVSKDCSASFDHVLDQVDDSSEPSEGDKLSAPADPSPLTPEQMAMMLSMVAPAPLVLPPPPITPTPDDSSSASSLTLVGAEGRSIPELLVRGTDVLEYKVSPASSESTSPSANLPAQTDFAPLQGKVPLQPTRGGVPPSQSQLASSLQATATETPSTLAASSTTPTSPNPNEALPSLSSAPASASTQTTILAADETKADTPLTTESLTALSTAPSINSPSPSPSPLPSPSLVRSPVNRPWDGRIYRSPGKSAILPGGPVRVSSLPTAATSLPDGQALPLAPNVPGTMTPAVAGAGVTAQPSALPTFAPRSQDADTKSTETPVADADDANPSATLPQTSGQNTPAIATTAASTGNLPSPKNSSTGRSEKSAGSVLSGRPSGVKPSTSRGKNVALDVDQESLDEASTEVGTNAANWGKTMYHETRNFSSAPVQSDLLSFGNLMRNDAGTTVDEVKTVSPAHATDLVHEIREIADGLWAVERNTVEVKFNFGEQQRLSVRVEYRDGTVQATFRTDSAEVRDAIAREWQAQSGTTEQRPYRVADPIFAAPTSGFSFGGDASRHQRSPEQQQPQQPAPFERLSFGGAARSAQPMTTSSPVSSVSPQESTGRLHALV